MILIRTIANNLSVVEDACEGLVDVALPPDLRSPTDLPSKVQFLFLGILPPVIEPQEVGFKSCSEGQRSGAHVGAQPLV